MPFDFFKKGKSSSKDKAAEPPAGKTKAKTADLAGKGFAEQEKALQPLKDKGGGKGFKALLGGGKDAKAKDDAKKAKPAAVPLSGDAERFAEDLWHSAERMYAMSSNFVIRFGDQVEDFKARQEPLSTRQPIADAKHAQSCAKTVMKTGRHLERTIALALKSGDVSAIKVAATDFMAAAAALHTAIFGHAGPDKTMGPDAILGVQHNIKGERDIADRAFGSHTSVTGEDETNGFNKVQMGNTMRDGPNGTGAALRGYADAWAGYYQEAVNALAGLG